MSMSQLPAILRESAKQRQKTNRMLMQVAAVESMKLNQIVVEELDSSDSSEEEGSHDQRRLPRRERKVYAHDFVRIGLQRDYFGPNPLFDGREFDTMFRISKPRFQRLMEDIAADGVSFYLNTIDAAGKQGSSFEARLLLPLKTMAYGVGYHMLRDHFQMSSTQARKCCVMFDRTIKRIYENEYLRLPTKRDIKAIEALHKAVHNFPGMFGSLDCMHTQWKNCPTAWQGQYKGKESKPSIILEAISDYHMWFWHAAYGFAGTLNDLNILTLSPWFASLLDGTFEKLEESVVPFQINGKEFKKMYVLVDGIYPQYSRFVQGLKSPVGGKQKKYTAWQEACRKDIERAFGVLQAKWQCVARPMHQIELQNVGARMAACLILHNMCVSDRVMGDVRANYDPSATVCSDESVIEYPGDVREIQGTTRNCDRSTTGISNVSRRSVQTLTRQERWLDLENKDEHSRLFNALVDEISLQS